jgi:hypothetical protein
LFDSGDGTGVYSALTIKLAKTLFFRGLSAFFGGVPDDFLSPGKRLSGDFVPVDNFPPENPLSNQPVTKMSKKLDE